MMQEHEMIKRFKRNELQRAPIMLILTLEHNYLDVK